MFSTTKGATAVCANQLAQEGALDVDAPVAEYWPEFAQAGKETIPVELPALATRPGSPGSTSRSRSTRRSPGSRWSRRSRAQAPVWEPGTAHGYHAVTYGYLVGEVVRRISGRALGTYFREEVAEPLGLDFWIGLPEEQEPRVAPLVGDLGRRADGDLDDATRAR